MFIVPSGPTSGHRTLKPPGLNHGEHATLIAVKHRKLSGVPYRTYEALACELNEAMSFSGQADMRSPAISKAAAVDRPNVPIAEAAARLGISDRHARRLAPKLGGKKIAGCWFVDETALAQHIEGRQ